MKKKHIAILIVLIFFIIIAVILCKYFLYKTSSNEPVQTSSNKLNYDIKITKIEKIPASTGAATINYQLINIEQKKLYFVYGSGFMGDTIRTETDEQELTQDEIDQIKLLENMESEKIDYHITNNESASNIHSYNDESAYYWRIEYKGKTIELNKLPFDSNILKYKGN